MSLTNPKTVVTEERLAEFYQRILPYLGQGSSGDFESGGHTILDTLDTELTQRDILKFSGDFDVSDDSTNEQTVVKPHELTFEELNEIITPIPINNNQKGVIFDERGTEYVVGKYIYSDGTSRPIYQKTIQLSWSTMTQNKNTNRYIAHNIPISTPIRVVTLFYKSNNNWIAGSPTGVDNDYAVGCHYDTTNLFVTCGNTMASRLSNMVAIIQYTKSTDTSV